MASLLAGKDQTQSSGDGQNSNTTTTDANGGQTQNQTPATATQSFTAGTEVTLSAEPIAGYELTAYTVTAAFNAINYSVIDDWHVSHCFF